MKKVLVTGAAGSIGYFVLKFLLSEGKYEITALDLKNKRTVKRLRKYRKRVNVIYGDVNDTVLMEALVKDHDYIIHLASVTPPLGNLISKSGEVVDYLGTENIIKAINYYNKNCFLIYPSTTDVYDNSLSASVNENVIPNNLEPFSYNKFATENLIRKKLKNYTIFRLSMVLNYFYHEPFILNIKKNSLIEVTTNYDAAYALVKAINYQKELNRKTFNVGMGKDGQVKYNYILKKLLTNYGLSFKYGISRILLEKNYKSPVLLDSDELENIIHYRSDSLYNYFNRLKTFGKNRKISKILAKPLIWLKNKE